MFVKKLLLHILMLLCFCSCSEVLYLSIEQVLPPKEMPQHLARRVGIVCNFNHNNIVVAEDETVVIPCDANAVKEQVALLFANSGVMEHVVLLDSLPVNSDNEQSRLLSQKEVNDLCQELDVEMIYSIDYACLTLNSTSGYGSHPLNAYLCSRLYTPDQEGVMGACVLDEKSIDCWVNSSDEVANLIPRVPAMLAQSAVASYLPSWKERERVFYHNPLSYALREAKVYVYEVNWEAAAREWQSLTISQCRPFRFMAYYNLALYYEMKDDIDAALRSLDMAEALATKRNKAGEGIGFSFDTSLLEQYREVLQNRRKELDMLEKIRY